MPKERLTDRRLASVLPSPTGKRIDLMDALVPGLGVRVSHKGQKSFFLLARYPGSDNPTRRSLGKYGAVSLAEARSKAREWLEMIEKGLDPELERQSQISKTRQALSTTFGSVVEDYCRLALIGSDPTSPLQKKGPKVARELTQEFVEGRSNGRRQRPGLRNKPIGEISPRDVIAVIDDAISRGAPYQAHNLLGHIRTFFNWVIARGVYDLDRSPCDRMRPKVVIGKKALRTRVLNDTEIFSYWNASKGMGYPYGPLFQLLLLTGQRKSEVAEATLSEFDLSKNEWIISAERTKSNSPHHVPLGDMSKSIIEGLPNFDGGDFLFSTTFGVKAVNGFSVAKKRLDRSMHDANGSPIQPFVIHDIRRTVRTRLSSLPVSSDVAELVIGHAKTGLRRVYDQYSYLNEKRVALEMWEAKLLSILSNEEHKQHQK